MAELLVPISPGELIDKITILEIKSERMTDAAKLQNVRTELALLNETWRASPYSATEHRRRSGRACATSTRSCGTSRTTSATRSAAGEFDGEFIRLARAVYVTNDERAAIKKRINTKLGSTLVEEKSYKEYKQGA